MLQIGSQNTNFAVFTFVLLWATNTSNSPMMSCEASRGTVKYVDRCPRNKSEWLESARNKNCSRINQNCSSTEFVYHCLINQWENATVEVCALRVNIIGKCAEYNIKGAVVQEHARRDCRSFQNPCPAYYKSDQAYLYQKCYDGVVTTKQNTAISAASNRYIITVKEKHCYIILIIIFLHGVIRCVLIWHVMFNLYFVNFYSDLLIIFFLYCTFLSLSIQFLYLYWFLFAWNICVLSL